MKLLDRFEQLVIENARLKEENDHLKDMIAEECAHSSQLREEINSLKDQVHDLKCDLQSKTFDLEHERSSTNYYRTHAVSREKYNSVCERNSALIAKIDELNARLINSGEWSAIADQLLENDVLNEKGEFNFKIERIKQFREKLHCGLKEAKDAIEAAMNRKMQMRPVATPATLDD